MGRRLVLGSLLLLGLAGSALANGRAPGTSTINFRQGNPQHIVAGMTFGVTESHDGGATWHWMCEKAVRYGGMYDPDYAYSSTGALFATTFDGSLVRRDGCVFELTPKGAKFMSAVTVGPDNAVYLATAHPANPTTSDPGDSAIYKSLDDGLTFPIGPTPGQVGDWWNSIEVAPSNALRVYLSGYRLNGAIRTFLLFRSNDGGASYQAMGMTGLTTTKNSTIDIVGIGKTDPDKVYARVTYQNENAISDGLFRSTDGGATWQPILQKADELAFVVRANGNLVAGGKNSGLFTSVDNGTVWTPAVSPPHVNCLVEDPAGAVWACTQNFGANQVASDDAGIMKSTDLVTWTKVLRYQDIKGPVECPAGTLQQDLCVVEAPSQWCGLRSQLGIVADPTACPAAPPDGAGGPDNTVVKPPESCCSVGQGGAPAALALLLVVGIVLGWPRRRRAR